MRQVLEMGIAGGKLAIQLVDDRAEITELSDVFRGASAFPESVEKNRR